MEEPDNVNFLVFTNEKGKEQIRHFNPEGLIYLTGDEVSVRIVQVEPVEDSPEFI